MRGRILGVVSLVAGLASAASFAAPRGGGRAATPGGHSAPLTPAEAERAKTAKAVDEIRATLPQHPPAPTIVLPSKNASFLAGLRYAEQPRAELDQYLVKMWSGARDDNARRAAVQTLWDEAEKPKWARAAIEEFFRQRTNGQSLRPPDEPPAPEPARLPAAPEPGKLPAPEPAKLPPAPEPAKLPAATP
jgi:hypothetical protein